jgi:hypothetical protein
MAVSAFAETIMKHMKDAEDESAEEDLSGSDASDDEAAVPPPNKRARDEVSEDEVAASSDGEEEDESDSDTAPPGSDDDDEEEPADDDEDEEADEDEEEEEAPPSPAKPSVLATVIKTALKAETGFGKHGNLRKAAVAWQRDDEPARKAFDKVQRKIAGAFTELRDAHADDIEFKQFIKNTQKCNMEVIPYVERFLPEDPTQKCVICGEAATHLFTMVANQRTRYLDHKIESPKFIEWMSNNPAVTYSVALRKDCIPCAMALLQLASFNDIMYAAYAKKTQEEITTTFEAVLNLTLSMV